MEEPTQIYQEIQEMDKVTIVWKGGMNHLQLHSHERRIGNGELRGLYWFFERRKEEELIWEIWIAKNKGKNILLNFKY